MEHTKRQVKVFVFLSRNAFIFLGPVVERPISANLRLNFNPGFFSFNSKVFSRIIFSILLRSSNNHIVDKNNYTEHVF